MRVVAMYRVSTEKQAEQGASLDAQQRRFRDMAAAQQWQIVAEFRGAESATQANSDRKVLEQVLNCLRDQEPDALYVHEQSRLTRGDELDVAQLMREMRERRTKVIVGGVVRDLESIDDRFMFGIQSLVDRTEAERICERIKRGKREKGRQGRKNCGRSPYGYFNPPVGDPRRGTLQIVPEQAAVVKRIFELAASATGLRTIVEMLNREGVPPRPGATTWRRGAVRFILHNIAYLGIHASSVWRYDPDGIRRCHLTGEDAIVVNDAHPAIVSRELWDRAHGRLPQCAQRPSLLGGVLWINGERCICQASQSARHYIVRGSQNAPRLRVDEAEESIWGALRQVFLQPAVLDACLKDNSAEQRRVDVSRRIKEAVSSLAKLQQRSSRLLEMRLDGDIDKDTFRASNDELQMAIRNTESAITRLRQEADGFDPDHVKRAIAAVRVALAPAEKLGEHDRRRVLRSVVHRIDAKAIREAHAYNKVNGLFSSGRRVFWRLTEVTFTFGHPDQHRACDSGTSSR